MRPELLLPAGNLEKLKIGLQYGGDAFFMGFSPFSLRAKEGGFDKESFIEGVSLIRKAGKTFYMTINAYLRGGKFDIFRDHIDFVRKELKPDAIIVADPGVFQMLREYYPEAVLHMSVQANITNYMAVDFWKKQGASRIILPRELTLDEIARIHENVPDIELEVFVHGAICMAYSGRCLLSNWMTERDSNQGSCSHSCRWKYKVHDEVSMEKRQKELAGGHKNLGSGQIYLEEEKRPGQFMPVDEDENGTYIMNSKDNCCLPYLKELADAGVCSFKVEGRNKTEYYLATVAKAYRKAIDDLMEGKPFDASLMDEINKTANRGFMPGYLFGFPGDKPDVHYANNAPLQTYKFIGMVTGEREKAGLYDVSVRNRLNRGEIVEIMTPSEQFEMKVSEMFDTEGKEIEAIHGGAGERVLKLRAGLPVGTMLRINVDKCDLSDMFAAI